MLRLVPILLFALLLSACGSRQIDPGRPGSAAINAANADPAWRYARLNFTWDEAKQPDWSLDALAANEIFAPLLEQHRLRISLWRFHRRAARDNAGHQFSLLIYSDRATAQAIMRSIANHPLVDRLNRAGLLRKLSTEIDVPPARHDIAATSDTSWSVDVQRSWPWFAMGVSQSWLALLGPVPVN